MTYPFKLSKQMKMYDRDVTKNKTHPSYTRPIFQFDLVRLITKYFSILLKYLPLD